MADLVEWLEQQLRTDEQIARDAEEAGIDDEPTFWVGRADVWRRAIGPAAVLRTIAAHRAILKLHKVNATPGEGCRVCDEYKGYDYAPEPCETVRLLAAIYQDRPGFDPSWIPEDPK